VRYGCCSIWQKGVLTRLCGFDAITLPFGEMTFMYAVVETGSKQYRVAPGDTIKVELLDAEAGKEVTLDRVLFVSNEGKFSVGAPMVDKASVVADVVEHTRGPKLIAFKMKRRKGYHRTVGHRQEQTVLKIKEIKA
jgi:large subunit ribosomal protein L21